MRLRRLSIVPLLGVTALLGAVLLADASGAARPPPPPGVAVVAAGALPHVCRASDQKFGASGYAPVMGVYYSSAGNGWASAPLCYPLWGNLAMSGPTTARGGSRVTVTAIPNQGSNSATWAIKKPGVVQWQPAGTPAKGSCLPTTLTCTVVLPAAGPMWQWLLFHVSMPRTYFIDSKGSFCVGVHACPGAQTNAWTYVGIPPAGAKPPKQGASLSVAVSIANQANQVAVGGEVGVTVKVTAHGQQVTNISLGKGLDTSGAAVVTQPASGIGGFNLGADASRTFSFKVKGVKRGTASLQASAVGDSQSSGTVHGAGTASLKVGETLAIDWTMPDRLGKEQVAQWSNSTGLPPSSVIYPKDWTANIFLTQNGKRVSSCNGTWRWVVTAPKGANVVSKPKDGCVSVMKVDELGVYAVRAENVVNGTVVDHVEGDVAVKDFLIVGVGDSNGSGEGNPPFAFDRCDRSLKSYQYLTAQYIEDQDPRTSVTFIFASCSGASTEHLYGKTYQGIRPETPPLEPQFQQIGGLVSRLPEPGQTQPKPNRPIDLVLMSIGVNNLGFGGLIKFCLKNLFILDIAYTPCQDRKVTRVGDGTGSSDFNADSSSKTTLRDALDYLQASLPAKYLPVAAAIRAPVKAGNSGLGVTDPSRVFTSQYPNWMTGDDRQFCETLHSPHTFAAWPESTWYWLWQSLTRLNTTVESASKRYGWAPVLINQGPNIGHGICSSHPYFATVATALLNHFNTGGPFHPLAIAHFNNFTVTRDAVCARLYGNETCDGRAKLG